MVRSILTVLASSTFMFWWNVMPNAPTFCATGAPFLQQSAQDTSVPDVTNRNKFCDFVQAHPMPL